MKNLWQRWQEWLHATHGRCTRHGVPLCARWYSFSGYDGMEIEFCPDCEHEDSQAKWVTIRERSGTESNVGPSGSYAPVRLPDLHDPQDRIRTQKYYIDKAEEAC